MTKPSNPSTLTFWSIYVISAAFGLACVMPLSDAAMSTCYLLGIMITTFLLIFYYHLRLRLAPATYRWTLAPLIGLFSFLMGLPIALLIGGR